MHRQREWQPTRKLTSTLVLYSILWLLLGNGVILVCSKVCPLSGCNLTPKTKLGRTVPIFVTVCLCLALSKPSLQETQVP